MACVPPAIRQGHALHRLGHGLQPRQHLGRGIARPAIPPLHRAWVAVLGHILPQAKSMALA